MAITYTLSVRRQGTSDSFSINATITDDTKMPEYQTESITIWGKLDTPERRQAVWDGIKIGYLAKVAATEIIATLETEGKSYLEGIL